MIAILEWTSSNVQQNIEQLQTPTMGVTINKKLTTTEPPLSIREVTRRLYGQKFSFTATREQSRKT